MERKSNLKSIGHNIQLARLKKGLDITPNYIFDKALNINKLNNSINIIDSQTLIYYQKLKTENKEFVSETIKHLYNMQKKR